MSSDARSATFSDPDRPPFSHHRLRARVADLLLRRHRYAILVTYGFLVSGVVASGAVAVLAMQVGVPLERAYAGFAGSVLVVTALTFRLMMAGLAPASPLSVEAAFRKVGARGAPLLQGRVESMSRQLRLTNDELAKALVEVEIDVARQRSSAARNTVNPHR